MRPTGGKGGSCGQESSKGGIHKGLVGATSPGCRVGHRTRTRSPGGGVPPEAQECVRWKGIPSRVDSRAKGLDVGERWAFERGGKL